MTCCENPYKICNSFSKCYTDFKVRVPSLVGTTNGIKIANGQGQGNIFLYQLLDIVDGFVTLDLNTIAEGFLNPFGSPYKIWFLADDQSVIEFTASDGQVYDSLIFFVDNTTANDSEILIDVMP